MSSKASEKRVTEMWAAMVEQCEKSMGRRPEDDEMIVLRACADVALRASKPLIHVSDSPLLVGDYKPVRQIQAPQCGRRAIDDLPIVMPGLVWVGDIVTDPEVLRQHAAALLEAAVWLAGAPRKAEPVAWRQDHSGEWNETNDG